MPQRTPGVRRRGKNYYIRFRDQFGRQHEERVGPSYSRAVRALVSRKADVEAAQFGLRRGRKAPTFREFIEGAWTSEVAIALKPSTRRGYEMSLRVHLLPHFGHYPLPAITRAAVKAFIAQKAKQQRTSYSKRNPNPNRPTLARKTIRNMVAVLSGVLETAAVDYELVPANPLRGILRRKNFPTEALRPRDKRPRVLEPEDFKRAVAALPALVARLALPAALAGLRWGELVGLRVEDVDMRRNKIRITRALYLRNPQTPKTEQSVGDVDMSPTVRKIVEGVPWKEGLIFSFDAKTAIGDGPSVKRAWRRAQERAGITSPIRWHDLRHQFVSLLIAAGKSPKYIAQQARHKSAGFTLDRYGHLFETVTPTPVEWPEDLLWPSGTCPHLAHILDIFRQKQAGEQGFAKPSGTLVNTR